MLLTLVNLSAKKGKTLLVQCKSTASRHVMFMLRDKAVERYEFIHQDPLIDRTVLYKEVKKMKTIDKPRVK